MRTGPPTKVLIVEDNSDQRYLLSVMLAEWGYATDVAGDGLEAAEKLAAFPAQVILTDLLMPRMDGVELMRWLAAHGNLAPAIVMTAHGDISKALFLVHELGAFWFLEKPLDYDVLKVLLARAAEYGSLMLEKERLQRSLARSGVLGQLVGNSPAMQRMFAMIQQVAPTHASVLLSGESGTGKEIVARTIHALSPRRDGPFVAINCAALPETLIESELFGHEKGSFTGAAERRAGCFELAEGGTLLLDEIGETRPGTQAKLLRVLEDKRVRRLGGKVELQVDVRVLAATNKIPEVAVQKGELRRDLYYRLNVFHFRLPPLREREGDIPLIAEAMLADLNAKHSCRITGLHPAVMERFEEHGWPGNVRELRNVLERAVIVAREGTITLAHLPPEFSRMPQPPRVEVPGSVLTPQDSDGSLYRVGITVDEAEKRLILKTLNHIPNKSRAAAVLGISLKTLHNKLRKYTAAGGG